MEIITDQNTLRQISKPVEIKDGLPIEAEETIKNLLKTIPVEGVGLAAPQIADFKRIFVARLSKGTFIFVNPSLTQLSSEKFPSDEGCLSIPDKTCCIARHNRITVEAEAVRRYDADNVLILGPVDHPLSLRDRDAAIVQHEYDHLEGILMVDHPPTVSREERIRAKQQDRTQRITRYREAKKKTEKRRNEKVSSKRIAHLKKLQKQANKRRKRRVEVQEQVRALEENLFDIIDKE